MKKIEIIGMGIEYPDSFSILSQDETNNNFTAVENRWAVRDDVKNTMISLGWTSPMNIVSSLLVSPKSFLKDYEKKYANTLKGYTHNESVSLNVCGTKAEGFSYSYEANDTGKTQVGWVMTFGMKKQIYVAECTAESANEEYCKEAFASVMKSIHFR